MADGLKGVKAATAVLVTCLVQTLSETNPAFQDRFLKRLGRAYSEAQDKAGTDELELLSWTRELLTGFNRVTGQGEPFLGD